MRVGFTGTRGGMTDPQKAALSAWFARNPVSEFRHGSATGADEQAVTLLLDLIHFPHLRGVVIHAYPCDVPMSGSAGAFILSHEKHAAQKPLERNKDIVEESAVLLAAPQGMEEEQRSGTWATVRHARKCGVRVVMFWPNGTVTEDDRRDGGAEADSYKLNPGGRRA